MKISKERWEKMKKSGKKGAKAVAKGGGSTLVQGGTGFVAAYAVKYLDKVEAIRKRPWGKGAALIALGHLGKRNAKLRTYAGSACVLGGYLLGEAIRDRKATTAEAPPAESPALPPAVDTQGWDTGIVNRLPAPAETGAVGRIHSISNLRVG
jgi:hypothetical protein